MRTIVLYDSHCSACSDLVGELRVLVPAMEVRSLRDEEMIAILDAVQPGWRHEPMPLEGDGDHWRVRSGAAMRWRVARLAGLRRAWRLMALVRRAAHSRAGEGGFDRRGFLARAGVAMGTLLLGWRASEGTGQAVTRHAGEAVATKAPVLRGLRRLPAVRRAERAFGRADWRNVHVVRADGPNEDDVYFVPLIGQGGRHARLMLSTPQASPGADHARVAARPTGDAALFDDNFVIRIVGSGTSAALVWSTSDGRDLARRPLSRRGEVQAGAALHPLAEGLAQAAVCSSSAAAVDAAQVCISPGLFLGASSTASGVP